MKTKYPTGTVTERLGGIHFRVLMDTGTELIAYLAGKLRTKKINVYVGDRVEVVIDPKGGHATNRIVWRH